MPFTRGISTHPSPGPDRPRCSSDLISQSIALVRRKPFGGFEDLLLNFKCQFIDPQILKARYLLAHFHFLSVATSALHPRSSVACPPAGALPARRSYRPEGRPLSPSRRFFRARG